MNTTLDPQEFAERLNRSFDREPAGPAFESDLRAGKRRLRRRRTAGVAGVFAVAVVVAGSYAVVAPGQHHVSVAAHLSDAQVVARCLDSKSVDSWQRHQMARAELASTMGDARLMTRGSSTNEVLATIRSADGRSWGDCTLPKNDRSRENQRVALYRTSIGFPSHLVDGTKVYEPQEESDPRIFSVGGTGPQWDVDCFPTSAPEETKAFYVASSKCPTFSVVWNDRRPAEVAAAKVTNPDGTTGWADVRDGYLTYAYSGRMTPAMRTEVRSSNTRTGTHYGAVRDIELYDAEGRVIARGTGLHDGFVRPTILNYPSLADTFKRDRTR